MTILQLPFYRLNVLGIYESFRIAHCFRTGGQHLPRRIVSAGCRNARDGCDGTALWHRRRL